MKANKVQVAETGNANNFTDFLVDEALQLAHLIVVTTNLFPQSLVDNLKTQFSVEPTATKRHTHSAFEEVQSSIDFLEHRGNANGNDNDEQITETPD